MSKTYDFYVARAAEAAAEAIAASLDNVRERALRSEAAWREMAERVERVENDRKIAADAKRDRIAAELDAFGVVS